MKDSTNRFLKNSIFSEDAQNRMLPVAHSVSAVDGENKEFITDAAFVGTQGDERRSCFPFFFHDTNTGNILLKVLRTIYGRADESVPCVFQDGNMRGLIQIPAGQEYFYVPVFDNRNLFNHDHRGFEMTDGFSFILFVRSQDRTKLSIKFYVAEYMQNEHFYRLVDYHRKEIDLNEQNNVHVAFSRDVLVVCMSNYARNSDGDQMLEIYMLKGVVTTGMFETWEYFPYNRDIKKIRLSALHDMIHLGIVPTDLSQVDVFSFRVLPDSNFVHTMICKTKVPVLTPDGDMQIVHLVDANSTTLADIDISMSAIEMHVCIYPKNPDSKKYLLFYELQEFVPPNNDIERASVPIEISFHRNRTFVQDNVRYSLNYVEERYLIQAAVMLIQKDNFLGFEYTKTGQDQSFILHNMANRKKRLVWFVFLDDNHEEKEKMAVTLTAERGSRLRENFEGKFGQLPIPSGRDMLIFTEDEVFIFSINI